MVVMALDTDENAHNSREETPLFNRGSEVEVRSDEEGFGGAWFPATIVEFTSPKSSSKKRRKGFLVQYKSLVTDDESRPLTENVDPNLVRPSPPQETENGVQVFEENDAVDAWYRDGWWNGIVCKVLEASRYRLYFDKPPDVIDFDGKDLRVHLDWVNGKWVRPEKQQSTGSIFSSGTAVEVNLAKENAWDAWYPALIVKEYENCTYLVKYPDSMSSDESGMDRAIFDSPHIRPAPPHHADRNYELLEKVDVQFGHGWRTGTITKVLTGRRYNVYLRQGNEDTELNHTEIRPHLEWVDGEWISKTKEAMNIPNSEILSVDQKGADHLGVVTQLESLGGTDDVNKNITPCSTIMKKPTESSTDCSENLPSHDLSNNEIKATSDGDGKVSGKSKKLTVGIVEVPFTRLKNVPLESSTKQEEVLGLSPWTAGSKRPECSKKPVVCGPPPANIESPLARKKVRKLTESNEQDGQKANLVTRKGRPIKSPNRGPHESAAAKLRNSAQHINEGENKSKEAEVPVIICLEAQVVGNSSCQTPGEKRLKSITNYVELEKIMQRELAVGQSSGKRKRGRQQKLVDANLIEKETDGTNEDCQTDCRIKENDLAIAVVSKNVVDDDQPLSMWFGGMHSSTNVGNSVSSARSANGWSDTRDGQADISMEGSVNDGRSNSMPESNLCLPFVKKSAIWKAIEAMEALQIIPQNPHFEPLAECKEEYREGTAIGYMVTFTSLFEKVSLLQFNDPRNIFESTLESLLGLEKHGFDVAILKDRVSKLLSIKESQGELLKELTNTERQIMERSAKKQELLESMIDLRNKIAELQEELAASQSKMEAEDIEISTLRSHVEDTNQRITNFCYNFKSVAGAPWKSS